MTPQEILQEVNKISIKTGVDTVILTGGEPLIQPHDELQTLLFLLTDHEKYAVHLETNGTIYDPVKTPNILRFIDTIVVSPKPPSSGQKFDESAFDNIMWYETVHGYEPEKIIKVVVKDEKDYEFAVQIHRKYPNNIFIFQTESEKAVDKSRVQWLVEKVLNDPRIQKSNVRVLVQMHKLIWGNRRGV